jgi:hypothetical protein
MENIESMKKLIVKYILEKYGIVSALKSPIGYSKYWYVSPSYKIKYHIKHLIWRIDKWLFNKYCDVIKVAWENPPPQLLMRQCGKRESVMTMWKYDIIQSVNKGTKYAN